MQNTKPPVDELRDGVLGHNSLGDDKPSKVTDYFESEASYWDDVYQGRDVQSAIYQLRLKRVLALVDRLSLPAGSHVLDLGCGAGLATVALARRGYIVEAVDAARAMLERTVRHAAESGVCDRIRATVGDIFHLAFPEATFALVLAIGVIPWLDSPQKALKELARVLKPGGYLLVTADNSRRLNVLLDPLRSPALSWFRQGIKRIFRISWWKGSASDTVCSYQHSVEDLDQLILAAGLKRERAETLGFGPFTVLDRTFLPEWLGVRVHRATQFLATLKCPGLQSTGSHVVMLAKKSL